MAKLYANVVYVTIPDGHKAAQQVAMGDVAAKVEAVRLRKEFNAAVLDSLKDFAKNNGLDAETDFTNSGVNLTGVFFSCSDRFEQLVKSAAMPHVGTFIKNDAMFIVK